MRSIQEKRTAGADKISLFFPLPGAAGAAGAAGAVSAAAALSVFYDAPDGEYKRRRDGERRNDGIEHGIPPIISHANKASVYRTCKASISHLQGKYIASGRRRDISPLFMRYVPAVRDMPVGAICLTARYADGAICRWRDMPCRARCVISYAAK